MPTSVCHLTTRLCLFVHELFSLCCCLEICPSYALTASQAGAAGVPAEGLVPAGAFSSAAGHHESSRSAAADPEVRTESGSGQRVSGGPGEGARDHEPTEAAPEASHLGPSGFGDETGGRGQTTGQEMTTH